MKPDPRKFPDHFSHNSQLYAQARPGYPPELFRFLSMASPGHELAWDCATGSGQAALSLTPHFTRVIATDASDAQIAHAKAHPQIEYRVAMAEESGLEAGSVDLITVAAAVHWFELEPFWKESKRVLKPNGIIAIWTYFDTHVTPAIDEVIKFYALEILKNHWPKETRLVMDRYSRLSFPFERMITPKFTCREGWNAHRLLGFLTSWSGTQIYIKETGENPVLQIKDRLFELWGDPDTEKMVSWDLALKVGRNI